MKWVPPRGVKYVSETSEGAGATVEFSGGVRLLLLDAKEHDFPTTVGDGALDDLAGMVVPQGAKVISKRTGQVPAGEVARFVWAQGGDKTCLYYLPSGARVVLLSLTAPSTSFGTAESQFDLSLSKLEVE